MGMRNPLGRKEGGSGRGGRKGGRGKGKKAKEEDEDEGASARLEAKREVLKAADLFRAEGLLKHGLEVCLEGLTVVCDMVIAVEAPVRAHGSGPEGTRRIAKDYFVANGRLIRVWRVCVCVCVCVCGEASAGASTTRSILTRPGCMCSRLCMCHVCVRSYA